MVNYISNEYYLYAKSINISSEEFKNAIIEYKHNKSDASLKTIKDYLIKTAIWSAIHSKYTNSDVTAEDLISNIYANIEKILDTYKIKEGVNIVSNFKTYFARAMHNRNLTDVIFTIKSPFERGKYINKNILNETKDCEEFEQRTGNKHMGNDAFIEPICDFYKYIEERDLIKELLKNLNEKDGDIIRYYISGYTWDQSAKLAGYNGKILYLTREKFKKVLKKIGGYK